MQQLNHNVIKSYCAIVGINDIRARLDDIFTLLAELPETEASIVIPLRNLKTLFNEQKSYIDQHSNFLVEEFFKPFLFAAESAVTRFLDAARGRFAVRIADRLPTSRILQKKYPLHEEAREFSISIPLSRHPAFDC